MNNTIKFHAHHTKRVLLPQVLVLGAIGLLIFSLAVTGYREISKIAEITRGPLAQEALSLPIKGANPNQPISETLLALNRVATLDQRTCGFIMATRNGERATGVRDFSPQAYSQTQFDSFRNWDRYQLDRIYEITKQPVPIDLDPSITSTAARNAKYLVQFDVVDAAYHKDAPRAMTALKAYKWLNTCFDEYDSVLDDMIGNSIKSDMWSDEDFTLLRQEFLAPVDHASRVRKMELSNYADWLRRHNVNASGLGYLYDLDSGSHYPRFLQQIVQNEADIYGRHYMANRESSRRLALMAISAKQFHKKTGTWPTDFASLVSYDLPDKLWDFGRNGSFEIKPAKQGGVQIGFLTPSYSKHVIVQ